MFVSAEIDSILGFFTHDLIQQIFSFDDCFAKMNIFSTESGVVNQSTEMLKYVNYVNNNSIHKL